MCLTSFWKRGPGGDEAEINRGSGMTGRGVRGVQTWVLFDGSFGIFGVREDHGCTLHCKEALTVVEGKIKERKRDFINTYFLI